MSKALRAAIAALLAMGLFGCDNTTHVSQTDDNAGRFHSEVHSEAGYEYRTEAGYVYVITDTKTDVQYLAWYYGKGGGVCVLVDADGKPLLAGDAE